MGKGLINTIINEFKIQKEDSSATRIRKIVSLIFWTVISVAALYSLIQIFTAPAGAREVESQPRQSQDYIITLIQCLGGVIFTLIPSLLVYFLDHRLSDEIQIFYLIFVFMSIFLGSFLNFYKAFSFWDDLLHFISGIVLTLLGYEPAKWLLKDDYNRISPFFIAFFAFGFAMILGLFWEMFEFLGDALVGTNMQRYLSYEGEMLQGREVLFDTMSDIILQFVSGLVTSVFAYRKLK